jgi:hypothetical protein
LGDNGSDEGNEVIPPKPERPIQSLQDTRATGGSASSTNNASVAAPLNFTSPVINVAVHVPPLQQQAPQLEAKNTGKTLNETPEIQADPNALRDDLRSHAEKDEKVFQKKLHAFIDVHERLNNHHQKSFQYAVVGQHLPLTSGGPSMAFPVPTTETRPETANLPGAWEILNKDAAWENLSDRSGCLERLGIYSADDLHSDVLLMEDVKEIVIKLKKIPGRQFLKAMNIDTTRML